MGGLRVPREIRVCAHLDCGVVFEVLVNSNQRFCSRVCANRFNNSKEEVCEKHRKATKKQWQNIEVRKKLLEAFKKRVVSEETKAKQSISGKKRWEDPEEREKQSRRLKGKNMGDSNPAKRPEVRKKIRKANLEMQQDPKYWERMKEQGKKHSQDMKQFWEDPEYKQRVLTAMFRSWRLLPNKLERFLDSLFQGLFLNEYKFVGDGKFWIGGRNPDFINNNGQKKVIEFFGDWWHGEGKTGVSNEQHGQERIDFFARYGYQTLIIWECELENIREVISRIVEFQDRA